MKRYAVFMYDNYYPSGGWHDFVEAFDSIEEAKKHAVNIVKDYDFVDFHIVDLNEMKIIKQDGEDRHDG